MIFHPSIEKMSRYLDGELSPRQSSRFEAHLQKCPACQANTRFLKSAGELHRPDEKRLDAVTENVMSRLAERQWSSEAPVVGQIHSVSGIVLLRCGPAEEGIEAFPGCALREGDRLEPIHGASAVVEWAAGGRLRVKEVVDLGPGAEALPARNQRAPKAWSPRKRRLALIGATTAVGAVLAVSIHLPNVQEAITRDRVVRARVDQRSVASALEGLYVDNSTYSVARTVNSATVNSPVTVVQKTPAASAEAAYVTDLSKAPPILSTDGSRFAEPITGPPQRHSLDGLKALGDLSSGAAVASSSGKTPRWKGRAVRIEGKGETGAAGDVIIADGRSASAPTVDGNYFVHVRDLGTKELIADGSSWERKQFGPYTYDPTNGTTSCGDVWRVKVGSPPEDVHRRQTGAFITEAYDRIVDNPFLDVRENPLSTFSIDVDTASYANVRRFLNQGRRPPKGAVRIEEFINYFTYDYPAPEGDEPFSVNVEINDCPWNDAHRLARIGLKGKEIPWDDRPASNLVFLLDVSGSMKPANKLPLVKESMKLLVKNLTENDSVAIVVYAGASGLVLPPTSCDDRRAVLESLDRLKSGGSTNGGQGIELAYKMAADGFIKGGVNRVILATDGDFNVGVTDQGALTRLIEEKAKTGVFLSVLGFGEGNLKDSTMEKLADKGNGNYAYIDTLAEGRKALVEQISGTLIAIAKDVKIQVEFNPAEVAAYRLIGYANRLLAKEDFNDDTKDAGEIGAGHSVTALYEIVPAGQEAPTPGVDPLKYQKPKALTDASDSGEDLTVKLRYKAPDGEKSKLLEFPVKDNGAGLDKASTDFRFAAAAASFGMVLRDSPHKGDATLKSVRRLAKKGKGADPHGYRKEFLALVEKTREILGE
jgi:Ca-activated chloride channel family protein